MLTFQLEFESNLHYYIYTVKWNPNYRLNVLVVGVRWTFLVYSYSCQIGSILFANCHYFTSWNHTSVVLKFNVEMGKMQFLNWPVTFYWLHIDYLMDRILYNSDKFHEMSLHFHRTFFVSLSFVTYHEILWLDKKNW